MSDMNQVAALEKTARTHGKSTRKYMKNARVRENLRQRKIHF